MKELSVEEKAKLYDKAIAHARLLLKTIGNATLGNLVLKNEFENMFPELKKSEDEEIKKALITYHSSTGSIHVLDKFTSKQICDWIEKQGEQKPTDEVKSKFKVGDWIVYKDNIWKICNISLKAYYELLKINNEVSIRHFEGVDKTAHLWTIQDAKDGDVLATDDGICIFDGTLEEGKYPFAYCGITKRGFDSYDVRLPFSHDNNIHPATKEQRELLFQKMHEAGYVWDSERKELKKVEQKTAAWSQEDEYLIWAIPLIINTYPKQEMFYGYSKEKLISWLKSLKDRVQLHDRINIEVWVTKNKQWILKLNGKVVRGQWGDEPQCIYKQFFYLSEIESLKE